MAAPKREASPRLGITGRRVSGRNRALLQPGTILHENYCIERALGRGGQGSVYLAKELKLGGRRVAIKQTLLQGLSAADKAAAAQVFRQEAAILGDLDHPNLVDVKTYFEEGAAQYLVMAFIDGSSLEQMCPDRAEPPNVSQVIDWMITVAEVLTYLHEHDPPVIVRDLKPSNIMIDSRGRLRLIDFGIARVLHSGTETATFLKGAGTIGYAPMEQQGGGTTDARSDIYALGATGYRLLTAMIPPSSVALATGEAALTPPSVVNPHVPPALEAVLTKMMELRKNDRYASARTAAEALRALRETAPPTPTPSPAPRLQGVARFCHHCGVTLVPGGSTCSACGQAVDPFLHGRSAGSGGLPVQPQGPSSGGSGPPQGPSSGGSGPPQGGTPLTPVQGVALAGIVLLLAFGVWYTITHRDLPAPLPPSNPLASTASPSPSPSPAPSPTASPAASESSLPSPKPTGINGVWSGTLSGNDPNVDATFELEQGPNGTISGTFEWSSDLSGSCTRHLSGTYDAGNGVYLLHDDDITDLNIKGRVCRIEAYVLTLSGTRLEGTYTSASCHDQGRITLTRDE